MFDSLFDTSDSDSAEESSSSTEPPSSKDDDTPSIRERFVERIASEFDIESKDLLRRILKGLNLERELIREAVEQVFRDQDALANYSRVQSAITPQGKRRIVTAVRKKIRVSALQKKIGRLESELHWAEHEARMAEMEVANWLKGRQDDTEEYAIDPINMNVLEVPYNPYEDLLDIAKRLSRFDESHLRVVAEEELLPPELHTKAEKISQHSNVDAQAYFVQLAAGLLTLRPENRVRAVQGACMEGFPETPSSEDPPDVVGRLDDFRARANGDQGNVWHS